MNLSFTRKPSVSKRSSFAFIYGFTLLLGLLLLASLCLPAHSQAALQSSVGSPGTTLKAGSPEFVKGEILVRFRSNTAATAQATALNVRSLSGEGMALSLESIEGAEQLDGLRLAHVAPENTLEAIAALKTRSDVLYAEPNYVLHHDAVPNDPRYSEMYALNNTGQSGGVAGADIRAEQAWNVTTGSRSVVVGVVDQGVDINHPDLINNIWTNSGETGTDSLGRDKASNGVDDDGDGLVDDVHGWDFFHHDNSVFDGADTHGTHVAGTIGAVGNNGQGVVGVNWQVTLLPLKFLDPSGGGNDADAIAAILFAKKLRDMWDASGGTKGANVRVLSNSYGGGGFSQAFLDAIKAAGDSGILFVAAAGNYPDDPIINNDLGGHYPSSYDASNILAVAATDRSDNLASLSHYGVNSVHLAAPGISILSTYPNNSYNTLSGTSMATPHVSGVAALMCAANPNISLPALWHSLLYSTDQLPSLANKTITGGRLNAANAVQASLISDSTPPGAITDFRLTSQSGRSVNLAWTASGDDGSAGRAALYKLSFVDASTGAQTTLAKLRPGNSGTPHNISVAVPYQHSSGTFRLRVFDKAGNEAIPANIAVTVEPGLALPYTVVESSPEGLSIGGTALTLKADDSYRNNYALPFSFPFFGQTYSALTISTNGALYFSAPALADSASSLPLLTSQRMIAGLWDDLRTDVGASDDVYVVQPDANRIIFRWQALTYGNGTPASEFPVNFEIELRRDGTILTRYGTGNTNILPVVGISGGEPEAYAVASHTSKTTPLALTNAQTVIFEPNHVISGQVTAGGTPQSGLLVIISGTQSATTFTDASGHYSFALPAGGNYTVTPSPTALYTFGSQNIVNLNSNQTLNFTGTLRTYRISGRVTDGSAGIGGVTVNLGGSLSSSTVTDANGNYAFANLPAGGSYTLTPLDDSFYSFGSQSFTNLINDRTFDFVGTLKHYAISGQVREGSNGLSGVTVTLGGSQAATATTNSEGFYSFAGLSAKGSYTINASKPYYTFAPQTGVLNNLGDNQTVDFAAQPDPQAVSFSAQGYNVQESAGSVAITVTRSGSPAGAATIDYLTSDGTAKQRTDYTTSSGTLSFAPGETSKTFTILITDNAFLDGSRTVNLILSNPTGAILGAQTTAALTIQDNDVAPPSANPSDDAQFFVQQQYADFLNRAPDAGGLGYWTNEITKCGSDAQCVHDQRVAVADAFFFEREFQETGSYIYRIYRAALGPRPTYAQFISDRGRVVTGPGLEQSKTSYALYFVKRADFVQAYSPALSAAQFVDQMLAVVAEHSNVDLSGQRSALMGLYDGTDNGRAAILRQVAESKPFIDAEYNPSFVLMEYFGYLRRDAEPGGFDFWLSQVNRFPLRDVGIQHAMACSFITSAEYQTRFSSVMTRTNRECPQ